MDRACTPLVVLDGDPASLGRQHGVRLGGQIASLLDALDALIIDARPRHQALAFRALARLLVRDLFRRMAPRHQAELRALAQAAGQPLDRLALLTLFDDVLNLLRPLGERSSLGCSVALVPAPAGMRHLRQLDYYFDPRFTPYGREAAQILRDHQVLFTIRGQGVQPIVTLGWPGYIGTVTAWSGAAISLGSLTSYLPAGLPSGVPTGPLYRQALEVAVRLDDAVAVLGRLGVPIGNSVSLAQGHAGCIVELAPRHRPVVRTGPTPLQATNHFQDPVLTARQAAHAVPHSLSRSARLDQLLALATPPEELLDDSLPLEGGEHGAILNPGTVQGAIFDHGSGELAWRVWDPDGPRWVSWPLERLLAGDGPAATSPGS